MTRSPKVESPVTVKTFVEENNFKEDFLYYLDCNVQQANEILANKQVFVVYDSAGWAIANESSCAYNNIDLLIKGMQMPPSDAKGKQLKELVNQIHSLDGSAVTLPEGYKYYVVIYWQKFMGGKRGYKQSVQQVEQDLAARKDVLVIKVNTDIMQADNSKTAKYKLKLKQENDKAFFYISK